MHYHSHKYEYYVYNYCCTNFYSQMYVYKYILQFTQIYLGSSWFIDEYIYIQLYTYILIHPKPLSQLPGMARTRHGSASPWAIRCSLWQRPRDRWENPWDSRDLHGFYHWYWEFGIYQTIVGMLYGKYCLKICIYVYIYMYIYIYNYIRQMKTAFLVGPKWLIPPIAV